MPPLNRRGHRGPATRHPCAVTDCPTHVPLGVVACGPHWRAVPTHLRNPLIAAFRDRETNPDAYQAAVTRARDLVNRYAQRARTGEDSTCR